MNERTEATVVDKPQEKDYQANFEDIQKKIQKLQKSNEENKNKDKDSILEKINVNQLEEETRKLFEDAERLRRATDIQGGEESKFKKMMRGTPLLNRFVDKVDDKVFENSSMQSGIDRFMESMTSSRDRANSYLGQITERFESLCDALDLGEDILKEIDKELQRIDLDKEMPQREKTKQVNRWIVLRTNLFGINTANEFAVDQAEKARATTEAMTINLNNLQPILKNVLETQSEIAGQNLMNKLMIETINVGKTLVNSIQVQNQRDGNELLSQTVEVTTDPLITAETQQLLQNGYQEGKKKLESTLKRQSEKIAKYNQIVSKNQKMLGNASSDMELSLPMPKFEQNEEE